MIYKTVIIDDEKNSVEALEKLLEIYFPQLKVIESFTDPRLALEYVLANPPDLIFLDIQMPHLTGIDFIKKIPLDKSHVIFTTAYDQYAIDAIKLSAIDYLLKPIDTSDLKKSIDKIDQVNNLENNIQKLEHLISEYNKPTKKKLVIQLQNKTLFLTIKDILYLEADSNYTSIHMIDGSKHLTSKTIKYFQEKLENYNFFRPHQSFLINVIHIIEYDKTENNIILLDKKEIPVSKNKKENLSLLLNKL